MIFLLRVAFWLGVVLILLPSGGSKQSASTSAGSTISATEAVSAASATISDMRQFCSRQPDACAVGAQAATTLGQRAQAGAKLLYDFLTERYGPQATGSVAAGLVTKQSQHTLTPSDMTPAWRGPRREIQTRNPT
jgi:Family of unknown function (DUF5330)